eukprot:8388898-Alexandrium_andersonii.AAC.1
MSIHGLLLRPEWQALMDCPGLEPLVELLNPSEGPELLPKPSLVVSLGFGIFASMWGDALG